MKHEQSMARRTFLRKALAAAFGLAARLPLALPEAEAVEAETIEAVGSPVLTYWGDGGIVTSATYGASVSFDVISGGEWLSVTTA